MSDNKPLIWTERLLKSLQAGKDSPESRFMQVATCNKDGLPENRTLVFRQLDSDEGIIYAVSDLRTAKADALKANANAAICWYFTGSREQYRLNCTTTIITADNAPEDIHRAWSEMSVQGKKQFLWGVPGTVRQPAKPLKAEGDMNIAPPHFCKLAFRADSVDYLNLKGNPQYREFQTRCESDWQIRAVIP